MRSSIISLKDGLGVVPDKRDNKEKKVVKTFGESKKAFTFAAANKNLRKLKCSLKGWG